MMHERGKSAPAVVAVKPTNKAGRPAMEPVEPRAGTKGNAGQQNARRAQDRESASSALDRIRRVARERKKEKFTSLFHHISVELLEEAFYELKKNAAPGADGLTWQEYETGLERNLGDLYARLHRGAYRALPSRRVYIPKPDGRERPLAVAALGACPSSRCTVLRESDSTFAMSKYFRPWNIDQTLLLPPSVQDFVPKDHVSRFIVGLVRESLDLKEITGSYVSGLGQPPFDPRMMVALLLHGYASGLYSSRRIAKACRERNDFVMIMALDPPDFRTISDFRKRHLKALGALFLQVLKLCETAGLVKLGHVALDGTKIKANASKHKAMSYERMKKREAELQAEVARMLAAAEAADAQEDETFGKDRRGDELPDWVGDKEKRLAKIQQAMAALEAEAKLEAEEERRIEAEKEQQRQAEGRKKPGKPAASPSDQPDPKSQRNFTDPESRIMKSKDGFVQAYNAQAAVDAGAQIIVAYELTQCGNDQGELVPLIEAIENNLGRKPVQASADSGYCSESNLEALEAHGVDRYVAPGRAKHPTAANGKIGGPLTQRMRKKIDDGGFETPYRMRKQVVEPVFGQIKQARGFRQFLLRGVEKVRAEWAIICTIHNLLKLFTLAKAA